MTSGAGLHGVQGERIACSPGILEAIRGIHASGCLGTTKPTMAATMCQWLTMATLAVMRMRAAPSLLLEAMRGMDARLHVLFQVEQGKLQRVSPNPSPPGVPNGPK